LRRRNARQSDPRSDDTCLQKLATVHGHGSPPLSFNLAKEVENAASFTPLAWKSLVIQGALPRDLPVS
jgi:hypothetical protein